MKGKVYNYLLDKIKQDGTINLVLVDPDSQHPERAGDVAIAAEKAGASGLMIGGSGGDTTVMDATAEAITKNTSLPTIIFPGNISDITKFADAIFFMTLMNSRSRYYLSMAQAYARSEEHTSELQSQLHLV